MTHSFLLIKRFFAETATFLFFIFATLASFLFPYFSEVFFIMVFLSVFLPLTLLFFLIKKEFRNFWPTFLAVFFLLASSIFFLVFTKSQPLKIIFLVFISSIFFIFFKTIYRFLYEPRRYPPYSLENFSFIISFLINSIFLADIFALDEFLNFYFFVSMGIMFIFSLGSASFIFWTLKIKLEKKNIIIISLILLEIFIALNLLPTSFYINGLILTLALFFMVNLVKKNKVAFLSQNIIIKNIAVFLLILILIFVLAKWR